MAAAYCLIYELLRVRSVYKRACIYIYIWSIVIDCCSYITYSNSSPKKASAFVDTGQAPMTAEWMNTSWG